MAPGLPNSKSCIQKDVNRYLFQTKTHFIHVRITNLYSLFVDRYGICTLYIHIKRKKEPDKRVTTRRSDRATERQINDMISFYICIYIYVLYTCRKIIFTQQRLQAIHGNTIQRLCKGGPNLTLKNKYKINTVVQDESLCSVHTYCTYIIPRGFLQIFTQV